MSGEKEMNKKLKQALNEVFRAPAPVKKAAFLKQHRRRKLRWWQIVEGKSKI